MKFFLFGTHWTNAGPDNVNRKLIEVADSRLIYLKSRNKLKKLFETLVALQKCELIILSGICSPRYFNILKISGKKIVYLMHGDIQYENDINCQDIPLRQLQLQDEVLEYASRIVCVSEGYSEWVKNRYTIYKEKITFVNNGLNINRRSKTLKEPFSVAIAGGNRYIKANKYVCEAIKILHKKGIPSKLYVFGRQYPSCADLPYVEGMEYMGHLDMDEYYSYLDNISIFVMNSDVEPFGLTIADAINCNCSILMSKFIGASSILTTENIDIIKDNHNPFEIAEKIIDIEQNPNNSRLYDSIELENISAEASYDNLMQVCVDTLG